MTRTVIAGSLFCSGLIPALSSGLGHMPADPEPSRRIQSIQGPELYTAYCAVCHGTDAKGDGPMAKSLKAVTPDLTAIAARSGGKFPLARVQRIISGEEQVPNGHGTREMPVWGPVFSQVAWDQDLGRIRVFNLAKYLEDRQAK
jgi:mono/diheme cytochrome c family protein